MVWHLLLTEWTWSKFFGALFSHFPNTSKAHEIWSLWDTNAYLLQKIIFQSKSRGFSVLKILYQSMRIYRILKRIGTDYFLFQSYISALLLCWISGIYFSGTFHPLPPQVLLVTSVKYFHELELKSKKDSPVKPCFFVTFNIIIVTFFLKTSLKFLKTFRRYKDFLILYWLFSLIFGIFRQFLVTKKPASRKRYQHLFTFNLL